MKETTTVGDPIYLYLIDDDSEIVNVNNMFQLQREKVFAFRSKCSVIAWALDGACQTEKSVWQLPSDSKVK